MGETKLLFYKKLDILKIRPFGEKKQGDIIYTVLIKPDYFEPKLQWNMTTTVYIDTQ